MKRGERVHTLTPTPRRRSDPEFLKWDSEINAILDDDYEGEWNSKIIQKWATDRYENIYNFKNE